MPTAKTQSLLFGAALLTATQIFSHAVGFFFRVALSRQIGAEGMGLYQLVMPVYSVVMSVTLYGLTVAVQRLSASYGAVGERGASRRVTRLALQIFFILLGLLSLFAAPFSDWISVHLLGDARTRMGLLLLLPCIFFTGIENIYKNYFYGIQDVRPPAITEVVEQVLRCVCVLTLLAVLRPAYPEKTVGVIVAGMVLCEIVSALMLTVFYRRHKKRERIVRRDVSVADISILREIRKIAIPVSLSSLAQNLLGSINTIIIPGRLMVSGMGQTEALSAYGVAFGMTMPLIALPIVFAIPISLTISPRLARLAALGRGTAGQIAKALGIAAALVIPACLALIVWGRPLSKFLFGDPNAGEFVEILAVTQIFGCFQYLTAGFLNALGRQNQAAFNILITDAAQLALTWYAVAQPHIRLTGFVTATLATTVMGAALNLWSLFGKPDKRVGG
ncbi:polysaccharide biosynthesis protein [Clostridia bacterium]|nr:polysaccharide biosynthesis protein [Clostridia bacterium]